MSKRSQLAKRGEGQPQWSLGASQMTISYGQTIGTGADWFGPLAPMKPAAPAEVAGRQFDFASGYNLATKPRSYEAVNFATLRGLADGYDLLRTVIETRKDQVERMEWSIRVKDKGDGAPKAKRTDARTLAMTAFFKKPDGQHSWSQWLRLILEDMFVLD